MTCAYVCAAGLALPAGAEESAQSMTVFGYSNPQLAEGADALLAGRINEGIELTRAGLELPATPRERAAGLSNLCAGYAMQQRWDEALVECDRSLAVSRGDWRALNNRAAIYVAKGRYDEAITDVREGLQLEPESRTLQLTLEIIDAHKRQPRVRKPVQT